LPASVEAFHERETCDDEIATADKPAGMLGTVESAGEAAEPLNATTCIAQAPPALLAVALYIPFAETRSSVRFPCVTDLVE
jgi:hypothetical protein